MNVNFDKMKVMQRVKDGVHDAIRKAAIELQGNVQKSLNQGASNFGGSPSQPGSPPHNRTGALMRSIQMLDKTIDPIRPTWRVGTDLVYARIHEYGGRIAPKKGKFLAIPVGDAGRRAARAANGDIRRLKLRLVRTKSGTLLLVQTLGPGEKPHKGGKAPFREGGTIILFVLKKFVIMPARPYMRPAYNAAQPMIRERISKAVVKAMGGLAA